MKSMIAASILAAAVVSTGCGSDDGGSDGADGSSEPTTIEGIAVPEGPFESQEDLVAAADDVCGQANAVYDLSPVVSVNYGGIAAEYGLDSEKTLALSDKLAELEAPEEAADTWEQYVDAVARRGENYQVIADAAADEDDKALTDAYDEDLAIFKERKKVISELGLEVCGAQIDPTVEATGTEPASDLEFPEPSNTIEDVAQEWLEADRTGDCKEVIALSHSQSGLSADACVTDEPFFSDAELLGTEQYGPVGVATYNASAKFNPTDNYFVVDNDGELKFAGSIATVTGGIHPAPEGNDAGQIAADAVDAIRADDPDAFNETLSVDAPPEGGFEVKGDSFDTFGSDEVYGPLLVEDVRADDAAEAQPLGIGVGQAFYLLSANDHDYVLILNHEPGSDTDYAFTGYYGLFDAK